MDSLSGVEWLAVAAVVLGLALRLWPVGGISLDYDEGVYWQSLRAMAHGAPLFTSVFSSQPPFFLLGVYPFYLLFGQTLAAARLAMVLYSLLGLAAAYLAGRALGGRWVGAFALILLALDPLYLRESRTLQAEAPALAFALAGVALAVLAMRRDAPARRWLAAASGLALALGTGVKLFDAAALLPAILYLLAPAGPAFVAGDGGLRLPESAALRRGLRVALPDLLAWVGGLLAGLALVFLPFAGRWSALYDQVIRFHLAAGAAFNFGLLSNLSTFFQVGGEVPLELAAVLVVAVALLRRRWEILPLALWAALAFLLILRLHPLNNHDTAALVPALVLTVAAGLPILATLAPAALAARPWLPALAVLAALAVWGLGAGFVAARPAAAAPTEPAVAARALDGVTQPGDLVVADDQYVAGLADRDVPPQLVDTSLVRIGSGYLTAAQLEAAVQQPRVGAVLFYSGRFDLVPGFRAWVAARYVPVAAFGDGAILYAKLPQGPSTA